MARERPKMKHHDHRRTVGIRGHVVRRVVDQFHRPRGFSGRLAGWVMANRSSNRRRNAWVITLLDVAPTDRVLEIGFGPGIAIREAAARATEGLVCGVDHSEVCCAKHGGETPEQSAPVGSTCGWRPPIAFRTSTLSSTRSWPSTRWASGMTRSRACARCGRCSGPVAALRSLPSHDPRGRPRRPAVRLARTWRHVWSRRGSQTCRSRPCRSSRPSCACWRPTRRRRRSQATFRRQVI